jgi:ribosomal protein S18 acetylase RimI-like enzyme
MSGGDSALRVEEVPVGSREGLRPILDQTFEGMYLWHARRTLRSTPWVREAIRGSEPAGLSMSKMLGPDIGYIFYVAVIPSQRARGIGGLLLDDALRLLRGAGAREILACIRADNAVSLRLFASRGFRTTGLRELVHAKGAARAARLWAQMVVAPGERVFVSS